MAQITSSTSSVTPTSGEDWENRPINPQKVIQAWKTTAAINVADLTLYPAIKFVIDYGFKVQDNRNVLTDANCQYWIYASGDTATRDSDFLLADAAIGEMCCDSGGGAVINNNWTIINTSTYTVLITDYQLDIQATTTITLPAITAATEGIIFRFFTGNYTATINNGGSDTLMDGSTSFTLNPYESVTYRAKDSSTWALGD